MCKKDVSSSMVILQILTGERFCSRNKHPLIQQKSGAILSLAPVQCGSTGVAQVAFVREGCVIPLYVPELGLAGFRLECSSPMVDVFIHVTAL